MKDIPGYENFIKIELIDKGWSSDKKYYIETNNNEKLLLRLSDVSEYERKKDEYEILKKVSELNIIMTKPIDFGLCNNKKQVYMLLTWVEGNDSELVIPTLSKRKQYELGKESGRILKQIHSIKAPSNPQDWAERFNQKIDNKIKMYKNCELKMPKDDEIIKYIEDNRYLLKDRKQSFQHGDYHVGNLIVTPDEKIGVVDFNRFDYGDPWEEFNRIVFTVHISKDFACGQLNGYFEGNVPDEFFRLMALYIFSNALSSLPWAIPFGQEEIDVMLRNVDEMLEYYDDFKSFIPNWYQKEDEII